MHKYSKQASLIILICSWLIGCDITPPFSYQVRVESEGESVAAAQVSILISELAPLRANTDNEGIARIQVPANYVDRPGRLVVDADGYEKYELEINLLADMLPTTVTISREGPITCDDVIVGTLMADSTTLQPQETTTVRLVSVSNRQLLEFVWDTTQPGIIQPSDTLPFVATYTAPTEPGTYTISLQILCQGEIIDTKQDSIEVVLPPTDTPAPTPSFTPTPTNTPNPGTEPSITLEPTFTPILSSPTPSPSPTIAPTLPPVPMPPTATPTPIPPPLSDSSDIELISPAAGTNVSSAVRTFSWQGPALEDGQAYEVRIWHASDEDRYGAHDARETQNMQPNPDGTYSIDINVFGAFSVERNGSSQDYSWSVAIVEIDPAYRRLGIESTPRHIIINLPGGSSSGNGDGDNGRGDPGPLP